MDENKKDLENQEPIEEVKETIGEAGKEQEETTPASAPADNGAEAKPEKKASVFRGNKFKRGGMATVLTVAMPILALKNTDLTLEDLFLQLTSTDTPSDEDAGKGDN